MARGQLTLYLLDRDAELHHEHKHMIRQIGNFVNGFLFVLGLARNDDLCAFLTDLLQYLIQALVEKVGGV